jgi:FkbM family methyltransferase
MNAKFSSQYGEDQWISQHIKLPARGYFVEVGANDGFINSNTLYFEQLGWDGLLIDPDPRNVERLSSRERRAAIDSRAAGATTGVLPFAMHPCSSLSGLTIKTDARCNTIEVTVDTLTQILGDHDAPGRIDLLSIDTEGSEIDVWEGLDKSMYRPSIVIVEHVTCGEINQALQPAIEKDGYRLVHTTSSNLVLVDILVDGPVVV